MQLKYPNRQLSNDEELKIIQTKSLLTLWLAKPAQRTLSKEERNACS
jgi:hypothetical protein